MTEHNARNKNYFQYKTSSYVNNDLDVNSRRIF